MLDILIFITLNLRHFRDIIVKQNLKKLSNTGIFVSYVIPPYVGQHMIMYVIMVSDVKVYKTYCKSSKTVNNICNVDLHTR